MRIGTGHSPFYKREDGYDLHCRDWLNIQSSIERWITLDYHNVFCEQNISLPTDSAGAHRCRPHWAMKSPQIVAQFYCPTQTKDVFTHTHIYRDFTNKVNNNFRTRIFILGKFNLSLLSNCLLLAHPCTFSADVKLISFTCITNSFADKFHLSCSFT